MRGPREVGLTSSWSTLQGGVGGLGTVCWGSGMRQGGAVMAGRAGGRKASDRGRAAASTPVEPQSRETEQRTHTHARMHAWCAQHAPTHPRTPPPNRALTRVLVVPADAQVRVARDGADAGRQVSCHQLEQRRLACRGALRCARQGLGCGRRQGLAHGLGCGRQGLAHECVRVIECPRRGPAVARAQAAVSNGRAAGRDCTWGMMMGRPAAGGPAGRAWVGAPRAAPTPPHPPTCSVGPHEGHARVAVNAKLKVLREAGRIDSVKERGHTTRC